jgi:hypothetical protein
MGDGEWGMCEKRSGVSMGKRSIDQFPMPNSQFPIPNSQFSDT